jgi:sterol 3beta-glucosyltransferase
MQILLMTYGTRGDVEPFVALAHGFVKAGHTARLAAPETYAPLAAGTGVEYIPLPGDPGELAAAMVREAGDNPLRMIGVMTRFVFPLAAEVYGRLREAAPGSDAIVHSFLFTHAGYELAKALGVPDFSAQMFPMFAPTAEFAAPGFPDANLPRIYRKLTHILFNNIFRHGGGLLYNQVRRGRPDLPPLTGWPFSTSQNRITPLLFGFSEHAVPRPPDWPTWAHITGYWQMDEPREQDIPAEVRRFLEREPAPVFIGFGSFSSQDTARMAALARAALRQTGQRGVLLVGKPDISPSEEDPDILAVGSIPYRWLFPRMAAVVHHGGAGTTGAGLRAGVPNIVVPFTADQPFWAARVREMGAGPEPIPLRKLTTDRLAAAIDQALNDQALRARCRALGEKIDAEDGVERAVELITRGLDRENQ